MGEPRRKAEVSRAPHEPCIFCRNPTVVRISVKNLEAPGQPESSQRICVPCFKGIIDHMVQKDAP